jgi:hypothetical protein
MMDRQIVPKVRLHDLFSTDGTPYDQTEIEIFKKLTGARRLSSGLTFAQPALG